MQSKNYDIEVVIVRENNQPVKAVFYGYPVVFEGNDFKHMVVPATVAGAITEPTLVETVVEWVESASDEGLAVDSMLSRWMDKMDELSSIKPIRSIINNLPSYDDGYAQPKGN